MTLHIEFEPTTGGLQSAMVNTAGYIMETQPQDSEYMACRVSAPLKQIKEGDKLTIIKNGRPIKLKEIVSNIQYLD